MTGTVESTGLVISGSKLYCLWMMDLLASSCTNLHFSLKRFPAECEVAGKHFNTSEKSESMFVCQETLDVKSR